MLKIGNLIFTAGIKMKIIIDATFNPHGGTLTHLQEFLKFMSMRHNKENLIVITKKENIDGQNSR